MQCPQCGSHLVYRSRSTDKFVYRLVLCHKMRCHWCSESFLVPIWQTVGRDLDPPSPHQMAAEGALPAPRKVA